MRKTTLRLFVGGPAHGTVREISNNRWHWQIPVVGGNAAIGTDVVTYTRMRWGGKTWRLDLMVEDAIKHDLDLLRPEDAWIREGANRRVMSAVAQALKVELLIGAPDDQ